MLSFLTESLECIITPLLLLRTPRVTHPKAHERPQEELRTGKCSFGLTSIHDNQSKKASAVVCKSASQNTHHMENACCFLHSGCGDTFAGFVQMSQRVM